MEIIALLRGEQNLLDEWISILKSAFWEGRFLQADGQVIDGHMRTGVSPIIPVCIKFPEQHLNNVLGMIRPDGKKYDYVFDHNWKLKKANQLIAKSMGLKEIPNEWNEFKHPITEFLKLQKVGVHILGYKEDTHTPIEIETAEKIKKIEMIELI